FVNRDSDDARNLLPRKWSSEFRIALAHFTEYLTVHSITAGILGIHSEAHGNFSGFQVESNFGGLLGFRRIQIERCAERRMPGKRQFLLDREDADFLSFSAFSRGLARENKSRFRKIHLSRQCLHLGVSQLSTVRKNRQRITRKPRLREYIKLNEFVIARLHDEIYRFVRRTCNTKIASISDNGKRRFAC